jgi:hypothetical protein
MSKVPCTIVGRLCFFGRCTASSTRSTSSNSKSATNTTANFVLSYGTSNRPPRSMGRTVYFFEAEPRCTIHACTLYASSSSASASWTSISISFPLLVSTVEPRIWSLHVIQAWACIYNLYLHTLFNERLQVQITHMVLANHTKGTPQWTKRNANTVCELLNSNMEA